MAARKRRSRALEWGKNILIVLLVILAVYLIGRTGVVYELSDRVPEDLLGSVVSFFRDRTDPPPAETVQDGRPAMAAQAVRVAVYSDGERFAAQYDAAQADKLFNEVGGLLGEGLASARTPVPVSENIWRKALQMPGVYFDFLGNIPLDALYAWLGEGASNPNLTGTVRQLLLALDDSGIVTLYYSNEDTGLYYACGTSVAYEGYMEETLKGYGSNGVAFAFEYDGEYGYGGLDPYVLIASTVPSPKVYRVSAALDTGDAALVEALENELSFTPQSSSAPYSVQGGGITIRDGRETLTIGGDGTVTYHAPEQEASRYTVGTPGVAASDVQLIEAARKLAAAADDRAGSARLYLTELRRDADGAVIIRFAYSLNGATVRLPGGVPAAEFTVRDGQITDYTIRFRTYEDTGEQSLVLPEKQAAAAISALEQEGRELILRYEDNGVTAQAGWTAQ